MPRIVIFRRVLAVTVVEVVTLPRTASYPREQEECCYNCGKPGHLAYDYDHVDENCYSVTHSKRLHKSEVLRVW